MTCEEFRALLEREGTAAAQAGAEHLRHCPACEGELARWQEVEAQLAAMGEEPVPAFLHARIMAHLRASAASAQRVPLKVLRPVWAAPLLLAVVLLALGGVGVWHLVQRPTAVPAGEAQSAVTAEAPPPALLGKGAPVPVMAQKVVAPKQADRPLEVKRSESPVPRADSRAQGEQAKAVARGLAVNQAPEEQAEVAALAAPAAGEELLRSGGKPTGGTDTRSWGSAKQQVASEEAPRAAQLSRPPAGPGPVQVRCQLLDGEDFPRATVWLPEDRVPGIATVWEVVVGEGGEVEVVDTTGTPRPEVASAIAQRLPALPPPGRYRLTQAPLPDY
ncbi:MAG: hypothetical protein HXY19_03205 [Thermoanaerobaculaceae bacterium]|nr:hypothetical protein [Thermoanaerobaculaceae bacterium]